MRSSLRHSRINRLPFDMTIIAPDIEMITPKAFVAVNFSLRNRAEEIAMNIGHVAIMSDARLASIIFSALKNIALYAKTPVIPSRTMGMAWDFFGAGSLPSMFQVRTIRSVEAMAYLKNAIEKGPAFWETCLPAMKVPPQNIVVNANFRYIVIASTVFYFAGLHSEQSARKRQ